MLLMLEESSGQEAGSRQCVGWLGGLLSCVFCYLALLSFDFDALFLPIGMQGLKRLVQVARRMKSSV
ncbi:hypothetical protein Hdeb2414_s0024g00649301 [Helianthus debilis subsp. tardiflorus]